MAIEPGGAESEPVMAGLAKYLLTFMIALSASRSFAQGPYVEIKAHVATGDAAAGEAVLRWVLDTATQPVSVHGRLEFSVLEAELSIGPDSTTGRPAVTSAYAPTHVISPSQMVIEAAALRYDPVVHEYALNLVGFDTFGVGYHGKLEVRNLTDGFDFAMASLPVVESDYLPVPLSPGRTVVTYGSGELGSLVAINSRIDEETYLMRGIVLLDIRVTDALPTIGCGLADFDRNGVLNLDDIDAFVAEFLGGCP